MTVKLDTTVGIDVTVQKEFAILTEVITVQKVGGERGVSLPFGRGVCLLFQGALQIEMNHGSIVQEVAVHFGALSIHLVMGSARNV